MFVSEKGNGAYLNNSRMRVSNKSDFKNTCLVSGGPKFTSKKREFIFQEYQKVSTEVRAHIRKSGSAALDLAYVAAGRCDGYWQRDLHYWDIAAGIVIVREAGGYVTDFKGGNDFIKNKSIIAANSKINKEMIEVLNS